jgi:hypothetical protein
LYNSPVALIKISWNWVTVRGHLQTECCNFLIQNAGLVYTLILRRGCTADLRWSPFNLSSYFRTMSIICRLCFNRLFEENKYNMHHILFVLWYNNYGVCVSSGIWNNDLSPSWFVFSYILYCGMGMDHFVTELLYFKLFIKIY